MGMIGFKAFDKDLKCYNDFQYEIGHTYEFDGDPIPCKQGFHFCKSIADTYRYYSSGETRICKIEAFGDIKTNDGVKYCTNKIIICEEITEDWKRKGNSVSSSVGYCNIGGSNTGDRNTGNNNAGNNNTGDRNIGNRNTGNSNTGNSNAGNRNTGGWNTGDRNIGNYNTGNYNIGNSNTGDWNTANYSSGCFNTKEQPILMFDNLTEWTYSQWLYSDARRILFGIPKAIVEWVDENKMTDEEKENHPSYKNTKGYLKVLDEKSAAQDYWNGLSEDNKQVIYNLPNFDKEIFKRCTGIEI